MPDIPLSCDLQLQPSRAILRNRNQSGVLKYVTLKQELGFPRAEQLSTVTVFSLLN